MKPRISSVVTAVALAGFTALIVWLWPEDSLSERPVAGVVPMTNSMPPQITTTTVSKALAPPTRLPERFEEVVGIGAALAMNHETRELQVMSVLPGTPAARAGLVDGQIILKIDDVETLGMKLNECVERIRGPVGSIVRLELSDPQHHETNRVEIQRLKLQVHG